MTDRELLEAAAKAAGANDVYWCDEYHRMQIGMPHKAGINYEEWNPLTDDGDALRLAVKLNIEAGNPGMRLSIDWEAGTDPYAATRRAIVRAAAAMVEQG